MNDAKQRILELHREGFGCSQILLQLGLETRGEADPALIRAMGGLVGGVGSSGRLCGALSGGACLVGLWAGKGSPAEEEDDRFLLMTDELVDWFVATIGGKCGGVNCAEIVDSALAHAGGLPRCCNIVLATWYKVGETLRQIGSGWNGPEGWASLLSVSRPPAGGRKRIVSSRRGVWRTW